MNIKKLFCLSLLAVASSAAVATHQWSTYHWATTTGTVHLPVIDSVTSDWQATFEESVNKWDQSSSINQTIEAGSESSKDRRKCNAVSGKMKVCNMSYGFNGWAGLASINLDSNGHIVQGVAKMNDSYMAGAPTDERNHVMCQEMGHVYGLGHTSENGSSQKTCMDYSNDINSQWPNAHDYAQLSDMYSHLDSYDSAAASGGGNEPPCRGGPKKCGNKQAAPWGVKILSNGRQQIWIAPGENGTTWIHHVTLAKGYTDITHD